MVKGLPLADAEAFGRDILLSKMAIPLSAVRLKCALLSLQVLKLALGKTSAADS